MYYVLIVDVRGATNQVEHFNTREEALNYMESLPDIHYMVVLRNDKLSMPPISVE